MTQQKKIIEETSDSYQLLQNCIYDIKSLDEDTKLNKCRSHVIVLKCMQCKPDGAFTNLRTVTNTGLNLESDEYSFKLGGKLE